MFGGSRRKLAKNKRCYPNTLRPCSRMLLKVMKGGVKGVITPLGHLRRGGVGGHYPLGQSYRYGERGPQPAGRWPKNGITAAAANPEILPLEFLLGDDPVHGSLSGWIAEW